MQYEVIKTTIELEELLIDPEFVAGFNYDTGLIGTKKGVDYYWKGEGALVGAVAEVERLNEINIINKVVAQRQFDYRLKIVLDVSKLVIFMMLIYLLVRVILVM